MGRNLQALWGVMLALGLVGGASAQVEISEIRIDQPSTDNDEYFELQGRAGTSLDGLTYIVIGDGSSGTFSGVIEAIVNLNGLVIPDDGYFLAVESTFTMVDINTADLVLAGNGLNFENSDNVTHMLVEGFTGTMGQDLDTNDDCVFDITPWTAIVDSIGLVLEDPPVNTECLYGDNRIGPDGTFVPGHVHRLETGDHAWHIGSFFPNGGHDTPGTENRDRTEYNFPLDGSQEVPPTGSAATGTGFLALSSLGNSIFVSVTHDVANPTAAHIHTAPRGQNGSVTFNLGTGVSPIEAEITGVTPEQAATLLSGGMYVNVHSQEFGGGEIRGQIENPTPCSGNEVLNASCKLKNGKFIVKGKLKNSTPGLEVTFRLDDDANTDVTKTVKDSGKATGKFKDVAEGEHHVTLLPCDITEHAHCMP